MFLVFDIMKLVAKVVLSIIMGLLLVNGIYRLVTGFLDVLSFLAALFFLVFIILFIIWNIRPKISFLLKLNGPKLHTFLLF